MKAYIKWFVTMLLCILTYQNQAQGSDVIFVIDNSGSIDLDENGDEEYVQMKTSIDHIIDEVLTCNPENRVAVVQYVSNGLEIEFDFTSNIATAQNFTRAFQSGGGDLHTNMQAIGDALDGIPNNQILSTQTTLNRINTNTLSIFIFTDDYRSGLVNDDEAVGSNPAFLEYTDFKNNRNATFFVVHVPPTNFNDNPDIISSNAAAAIASAGGSYGGTVEQYPADPDSGAETRFYYPNTFMLDTNTISEVSEDLCIESNPPCEDVSFLPNPSYLINYTISWDNLGGNYEVEIISSLDQRICRDKDPNHPNNQTVSFFTTSNSISYFDVFTDYGFECFFIRVRLIGCDWSSWCYYSKSEQGNCIPSCIGEDILVTETILNTESIDFLGYITIVAENTLESGGSSIMTASSSIKLTENFHAINGSYYNAYIQDCVEVDTNDIITNSDIVYSVNGSDDFPQNKSKNLSKINNTKMHIYPNPTKDRFNIELSQGNIKELQLYNIYGKEILSKESVLKIESIDVQEMNPGIYILKVITDDNYEFNERVIIK